MCGVLPPTYTVGKLTALPAMGQADEGLNSMTQINNFTVDSIVPNSSESTILLRAIDPAHAYHVTGVINDVPIKFMIDTGASVSLIREDVWLGITAGRGTQLEVWDRNLVGVEGSPLSVRGATTLDITLAGIVVRSDFLVAKTLVLTLLWA